MALGQAKSSARCGNTSLTTKHSPRFLRRQEAAGWADDGCGMAVAVARGLSGHATSEDDATRDASLDAEKDALYDDLLDQMEARCH